MADGFAKRLSDALENLKKFNYFLLNRIDSSEEVICGSLVTVNMNKQVSNQKDEYYFISPVLSSSPFHTSGKNIKIITVHSPMAQVLLGLQVLQKSLSL